jgi:hypothetical protein
MGNYEMRRLKCIGGPNDGKWYDTPNGLRNGDYYRVPEYPKVSAVVIDEYISDAITYKVHEYIKECLTFNVNGEIKKIEFLRPSNMNLYEAVEHQFSK